MKLRAQRLKQSIRSDIKWKLLELFPFRVMTQAKKNYFLYDKQHLWLKYALQCKILYMSGPASVFLCTSTHTHTQHYSASFVSPYSDPRVVTHSFSICYPNVHKVSFLGYRAEPHRRNPVRVDCVTKKLDVFLLQQEFSSECSSKNRETMCLRFINIIMIWHDGGLMFCLVGKKKQRIY